MYHEQKEVERYGSELDMAAEILQRVHPIGKVKGIGRLEVAFALKDLFPENATQPITFADFSAANRERCESPEGFGHEVNSWSTSDWITAIVGELGEAANIAKKLNRVRDGIRGNKESEDELRYRLREELGDVFVYLDLLCQSLGFTVADAAVDVFNAKSREIGYHTTL